MSSLQALSLHRCAAYVLHRDRVRSISATVAKMRMHLNDLACCLKTQDGGCAGWKLIVSRSLQKLGSVDARCLHSAADTLDQGSVEAWAS